MKTRFNHLLLLGWLSLISLTMQAQTPEALNHFIKKETLKHAGISFYAVDLKTGKSIASYNKDMVLTPASTMKIVTTATATEILGESYQYTTKILHDGFIEDEILYGNLYIQGSGDPTLGSEYIGNENRGFVNELIAGLLNSGITSIKGNIIALDQLFGYQGIYQKWLWEDLGNAYAPGIYGISIFDNTCKIEVKPGNAGDTVSILNMTPEIPGLLLSNNITASTSTSNNSFVSGTPFSNNRYLYGSVAQKKASVIVKSDIPDPGLLLAEFLKEQFELNGIKTEGIATTYRINPQLPGEEYPITEIISPALGSIIRVINVKSNNHYAEHLYKLLTQVYTLDIPAFWKERGLDSSALFMYDGSGISPTNAVSANFLVDILSYMYKKSGKSGAFYKSLPVAGKEGTVASFLKSTTLAGKAHIKSGSISDVQSYAGYIEKGDKTYAFAVIVNNFTGKRPTLRKDLEQLLVGLF